MNEFFIDLFDYTRSANREIMAVAENGGDAEVQKLLSHIVNAHGIWNARISGKLPPNGVWHLHAAEMLTGANDENHLATIALLRKGDPEQRISYTNSRGETFVNTMRDILFHIVNHSTHHRAQVVSRLRAAGLTLPATDYIFYKRH